KVRPSEAYLGDLEETLGDVDDARHLLHVRHAALDGVGVVGPRLVQDVLDLLVLRIRPRRVRGATVLDDGAPGKQETEGNNGLLVHDVVLVADGVRGETGDAGENRRLGDEAAA